MTEVLYPDSIVNMSEQDYIGEDIEQENDEEEEETGDYSDFSTMIPHISNSNSQMSPVWQVNSYLSLKIVYSDIFVGGCLS